MKPVINTVLVNTAALLISLLAVGYLLVLGQSLLMPIVFATLIALFLYPSVEYCQRRIGSRALCIIIVMILFNALVAAVLGFLSYQVAQSFEDISGAQVELEKGIQDISNQVYVIAKKLGVRDREIIDNAIRDSGSAALDFVKEGVVGTPQVLLSGAIGFLFTCFFLYYAKQLKSLIVHQFSPEKQGRLNDILSKMQLIVQNYVKGLGLVMLLMAVLNSLGLFLLGVGYPLLWGSLAAILALIPYVGTILGGLLPLIYAAATSSNFWQPVGVMVLYGVLQQVEGNLITPKVVGNSVKLNPMAAFLAILIGGAVWGVAGVVLAIPIAAIFRTVAAEVPYLKPLQILTGHDLSERGDYLASKYDGDNHSIARIIKPQSEQE